MPRKLHADEVDIDAALVRRLLAGQFPDWAELPIEPVLSWGTDNVLYRVGGELVARLPRHARTNVTLALERRWLPRLAPSLPLRIPEPLAEGKPGEGYPFEWSVYGWLEGENATVEPIADLRRTAGELAAFVEALQRIDPAGGPGPSEANAFRGVPLAARDAGTRRAIAALAGVIDADGATAAWEESLRAAAWEGQPVWIHGDLDLRNLLVREGRLSAVVDWGCLGVGDPACDVAVAWKVFAAEERDVFRDALSVDDATWLRGRGWTLSQALMVEPYYTLETNPELVLEARCWLADILADRAA